MPMEAWENMKEIFVVSTMPRKLQLRQEVNIQQRDMTVTDYTTKIKEICDELGSINVFVWFFTHNMKNNEIIILN